MAPGPPGAAPDADADSVSVQASASSTTPHPRQHSHSPPPPHPHPHPGTALAEATHVKRDASPSDADPASNRKKKKTSAGSRGVASLTPEQLAKKRANDREAQRAIRERTKTQIENYERRIHELTNQQPYQDLQAVIKAKEAVEQENADLKRTLANIVNMIQPIIGGRGPETAYVSPAQTYAQSMPTHPATLSTANTSASPSVASPSPRSFDGHSQTLQTAMDQSKLQLNQQRHELRHGLELGPERLTLGTLLDANQRLAKVPNGINGAQDTPQFHHEPMKHDRAATMTQASHMRPVSWSPPERPPASLAGQQDTTAGTVAPTAVKNSGPTCPLDALMLDFLRERRQRVAEGLSTQETTGPRYPSVSSLLNPAQSAYSHPLSKFLTDILATFPDISTLPERVATLYVMFLTMRWQISPTQENYDRLPEWIRPRPSQFTTLHAAWMDHIPFPRMRDKMIESFNPNENVFETFFIPFTTTLNLNWPYEETDCLLQIPDTEEIVINPVFERHLRRLENWRLGEAFARAFPHLRDTCIINPAPPARPGSR